jgi:phage-related protein
VGSSKRDLSAFPEPVKDHIGTALSVVEGHDRATYCAVYVVRFEGAVYVLHAFQKKSPKGIRTSGPDVELVARRLKMAQQDYEERHGKAEE